MYQGLKVAVVIPCYRAEKSIESVIATMPDFVDTVIAVDDCSPDSTKQVLRRIDSPRLVVLEHERNQGVGGAMATGFAEALRRGADIVVKVDADGQMDLACMSDLVEPLAEGRCEYAKGNRFLHARELRSMPFMRAFGSVILTFLSKFASGYWHVFDPQNGYLAIAADALASLPLERLGTRRYFFENEMLIQLNVRSARVLDVPMPARYGDEVSSLRISRVLLYFPYFLTRGFLHRMFHRYVLRDFSVVVPLFAFGTLLFGGGALFGAWTWWLSSQQQQATPTGTIMLAVLPLILGFQMLLQGLLIDIQQSPKAQEQMHPVRHRSCAGQEASETEVRTRAVG